VYDQLEGLQRQLAQPGFSVASTAFMPLLIQTDEAIAQLSQSAHFADSSAYLHRFRQVLLCTNTHKHMLCPYVPLTFSFVHLPNKCRCRPEPWRWCRVT
jgi:hypothetical protein